MEDPFNNSTQEKIPEFLYTDNSSAGYNAVIFRCNARTIDEADKMFEVEKHYDPKSNSNIGCVTEAPVNEDWRAGHKN